MRISRHLATALVAFSLGAGLVAQRGGQGTAIKPGEECPPGMTEVRPGNCQAPTLPPPSIVDYRPNSTLVTPQHLVARAKYPAVDFHGHPGSRIMVAADNLSGERLQQAAKTIAASPYKDRVRLLAGIDFRGVGAGWADKVTRQLEADVKAGAVGVGEIPKSLGLSITKPDGTRLHIDDPALDPIWDACARLNLPVFIHTADPQEFFEPIDNHNERWLELALFPGRRYPADRFPRFEELMTERDNLFKRHPRTKFVAAHMGWHANDLARLGKMFDAMPNVSAELGAVLYDIGRQPRVAHDFFVKYQDRILFGKDAFEPSEYPYYWRVLETKDDYFDYYRNYHAFWKLYGIDLPDPVLKKVYYDNAVRLTPGLPHTGWPQ
jgi:uncharacterized protein